MKLISKLLVTILLLVSSSAAIAEDFQVAKILVSETIEHPALNDTILGIMAALEKHGYARYRNMKFEVDSAQASTSVAAQIASKYVNQKPDVVVGVGTLSAQSLSKYAKDGKVKLVFASVTDPVRANLVQNLDNPGFNTTGVSNFISSEPQLKLFKQIQPNLKKIGIIYNPGELNSITIIKELEQTCPKLGLTLVKQTANKTVEVAQAATKLANNCDAIFINNDNTALSAFQSVVKAANAKKIPVYCSDTYLVTAGALAALGPNQHQVGEQAGELIVRVIKGEDINSIPVEFPITTELNLNMKAAKLLNITFPDDVLKQADHVFEKTT